MWNPTLARNRKSTLDASSNGTTKLQQSTWSSTALESVAQTVFATQYRQRQFRVYTTHPSSRHKDSNLTLDGTSLQRPIQASVLLQVLLRLNAILFPFWLGIMVWVVHTKIARLDAQGTPMNEFYNFTVCFTLVLFLLVEPIRLVLGMRGNMREQIPELGGFLVLSVFPQLLILVYFPLIQRAHYGSVVFPVELSVCTLYLSLVVPELLLGYNCADRVFHMLSIPEPT